MKSGSHRQGWVPAVVQKGDDRRNVPERARGAGSGIPAPRLAAALGMRLQTEPQVRPLYFCLGPITRTARPLFRFVETARPNSSRLRSCARLPGEDLVLIGDLFSQSASRRSTT